MEPLRIVTTQIETAFCAEPTLMALVASSDDNTVEVIFDTAQAPAIAAGILLSSQDAVKKMQPEDIANDLAKSFEHSIAILPEAVDISLAADGDVLCINVGSGTIFFRLTEPAKRALNKPLKNIGTL